MYEQNFFFFSAPNIPIKDQPWWNLPFQSRLALKRKKKREVPPLKGRSWIWNDVEEWRRCRICTFAQWLKKTKRDEVQGEEEQSVTGMRRRHTEALWRALFGYEWLWTFGMLEKDFRSEWCLLPRVDTGWMIIKIRTDIFFFWFYLRSLKPVLGKIMKIRLLGFIEGRTT